MNDEGTPVNDHAVEGAIGRVPAPLPDVTRPVAPRLRARRVWGRALLIARRVHLYLGLALLPWALLYGVTAILFNHPTLLADAQVTTLAAPGLSFPAPESLAAALVAEVAATTTHALALQPGSAAWEHDPFWRFSAPGAEHAVSHTGPEAVSLRTSSRPAPPPDPLAAQPGLTSGQAELAAATALVTSLVRAQGLEPGRVRELTPELELTLIVDGQPCAARYDLREGKLTCRPPGAARQLSWRAFLTRLHTTHGYPSQAGARLGWVLVADLMGGALVMWALTGLLMWMPMRGALRGWGLLALGLGAATAVALAIGMHAAFTA